MAAMRETVKTVSGLQFALNHLAEARCECDGNATDIRRAAQTFPFSLFSTLLMRDCEKQYQPGLTSYLECRGTHV